MSKEIKENEKGCVVWRFTVTPKPTSFGKHYKSVTRIPRVEITDSIEVL